MQKEEIVRVLREMAAILEISGRNAFRARAFANGARALDAWQGDLAALIEGGEVASVRGIGKGLTRVIADLVTAGESPEHLALRASIPSTLLDLLAIQGLGPKKVKALHEALGITGIDDLEDACRAEQVRALRGFGARSESEILAGIERARRWGRRHNLPEAEAVAERLAAAVASAAGVGRIAVAGSLRRRLETVGDIDLLAVAEDPAAARAAFLAVPGIDHAEAEGDKRCRVVLEGGIGVDLRLVDEAAFPAALHHFTGSKSHNTHLRSLARQRGWKLNEYGLWDERGEALPIDAEGDIFRHLGLAWIPPELREDRGEIDLAATVEELPRLIEEGDLQGTLHCHTTASDGRDTLRQMVEAARSRGWTALGIADHSRAAAYAGGLSIERLREQGAEIEALRGELPGFRILHGIESDILADGSLDYPDDVLAELDYVVASVHSGFSRSRAEQTRRIERALRNPLTTIWGHPTGRLLLKRDAHEIDLDHLLEVAAEEGVIVEINANPLRLDLDWRWGERARELGIAVGIHPDAHSTKGLDDVRYGVGVARKAGFRAADVINTLAPEALEERLRARRR